MRSALLVLLVACGGGTEAVDEYKKKSIEAEAKVQLNRISKHAKAAFLENLEYPKGTSGPTPAEPCCKQPKQVCTPDPKLWTDGAWKLLEFHIDDPHRFQYSYESDGTTFTAKAVGDPGCTGKLSTFEISGKTVDNNPVLDLSQVAPSR